MQLCFLTVQFLCITESLPVVELLSIRSQVKLLCILTWCLGRRGGMCLFSIKPHFPSQRPFPWRLLGWLYFPKSGNSRKSESFSVPLGRNQRTWQPSEGWEGRGGAWVGISRGYNLGQLRVWDYPDMKLGCLLPRIQITFGCMLKRHGKWCARSETAHWPGSH